MTDFDSAELAARLDRITYLLVAVVALQVADLLRLGPAGLALFIVVGLCVSALYRTDA